MMLSHELTQAFLFSAPDGDISKVLNEVRLTQVDVELCALFSPVPKDRKKVICTLTENKDSCRVSYSFSHACDSEMNL